MFLSKPNDVETIKSASENQKILELHLGTSHSLLAPDRLKRTIVSLREMKRAESNFNTHFLAAVTEFFHLGRTAASLTSLEDLVLGTAECRSSFTKC